MIHILIICAIKYDANSIKHSTITVIMQDEPRDIEPEIPTPPSVKYVCAECGKMFTYLANLANHQNKDCKSKVIKVKCPSCNLEVKKTSLNRHLKTHSKPKINCPQCKKQFKTKLTFDSHMKTHKLKTCPICDIGFRRPFLLKKHTTDIHGDIKKPEKRKHVCPQCEVIFNRPWRLREHLEKTHGKQLDSSYTPKRSFKCKHCDEELLSDRDLKKHLQANHSAASLKCEICNKFFFTGKAFTKHMKFHEGPVVENKEIIETEVMESRTSTDANQLLADTTSGVNGIPQLAGL